MKVLCCHPSGLMYTKIFLRLEPLGIELVAAAARRAGHEVRLIDLQVEPHGDYFARGPRVAARTRSCFSRQLPGERPRGHRPGQETRQARCRDVFVFVGGHSASFIASEMLEHAGGAIDCVVQAAKARTSRRACSRRPRHDRDGAARCCPAS